jgi:hypothetical protein
MDEKEVQNFLDSLWDFISGPFWNFLRDFFGAIFNGVSAVLETLPPVVTGGIAFVIFILWAWHRVKGH